MMWPFARASTCRSSDCLLGRITCICQTHLPLSRAKSAAQSLADQELRNDVLKYLESFDFSLEGGQRQLLRRTDDYSVYSREICDTVYDLLRGE